MIKPHLLFILGFALLLPSSHALSQTPPSSQKHVVLLVETDGSTYYNVLSQTVKKGPLPRRPSMRMTEGASYVELKDAAGNLVDSQEMEDPTVVYFDYQDPGSPKHLVKGGKTNIGPVQVRVHLPYRSGRNHKVSFYKFKQRSAVKRGRTLNRVTDGRSGKNRAVPSHLLAESVQETPVDIP